MAKIFRTEELSVNGDNIRLTADANGNLVIKDSSSNVVTSTTIIASDVSSLTFKDLDLDADVSSLSYKIGENDVLASSVTINADVAAANTGDRYDATEARVTVDYGRTFSSTPKVVGIMRAAAGSPIIGCQLISVSTTEAQFQLSDDVATDGSYTIEVLISL